MRAFNLLIIIIISFFLFGFSNSDRNTQTVLEKKGGNEKYSGDDKNIIPVYDNKNLKTIEGIKDYLQGGWSLLTKNSTLYYYFDNNSVIYYVVFSEELTERFKDDKKFIVESKKISTARESNVVYHENGNITFVSNDNNKKNVSLTIIDEDSFSMVSGKDKSIFKRNSIEKPIVGKIYRKLNK